MKTLAAFAPIAILFAGPAHAVVVTEVVGESLLSTVTVVTQDAGLLEVDFDLYDFEPITINFAANADEPSFAFNSVVDVFTGLELGQNVRSLTLSLSGATFEFVGTIAPTFSNWNYALADDARLLTISLTYPGEPNAIELGNIDGLGENFVIAFDSGPAEQIAAGSLTLQAGGVPEPASWALMIAGFGLVGGTLRRRRSAAY